jgi:hypothetical protein
VFVVRVFGGFFVMRPPLPFERTVKLPTIPPGGARAARSKKPAGAKKAAAVGLSRKKPAPAGAQCIPVRRAKVNVDGERRRVR